MIVCDCGQASFVVLAALGFNVEVVVRAFRSSFPEGSDRETDDDRHASFGQAVPHHAVDAVIVSVSEGQDCFTALAQQTQRMTAALSSGTWQRPHCCKHRQSGPAFTYILQIPSLTPRVKRGTSLHVELRWCECAACLVHDRHSELVWRISHLRTAPRRTVDRGGTGVQALA